MVTKKTVRRASSGSKTQLLTCKVSPGEMSIADDLAARYGIDRSEVVRRALSAVSASPYLIAPGTTTDLKALLERASPLDEGVRRAIEQVINGLLDLRSELSTARTDRSTPVTLEAPGTPSKRS